MKSDDKTRIARRHGTKKNRPTLATTRAAKRVRLQEKQKRIKVHEQMLKEQTKLRDEVIPGFEQTLATNDIPTPAEVPATLRERAEILGRAVKEKSFDFLYKEAE